MSAQSDPSFDMTLPEYVRQPVTAQDGNYVLNRCGALLFTMGEFLEILRPEASDTAFQRSDVYLWASAELSGRGVAAERRKVRRMNDVYGEAIERRLNAGGPLLTDELEADLDYCKDVEGAVAHAVDVKERT
ncbi:MAG: hypothetical protein R3316_09480 [Rhodovibrionaceae bacterium]|nr:hypothetical protein [Rhodovibrionaceae bacterium]